MRIRADFPDFRKDQMQLEEIFRNLPAWAANAALNFSKDSWRRGGWIDQRFERWPRRKKSLSGADDAGRAVLVKSGRLRRSLRLRVGPTWFEIGTDVPYARAHNEGAVITQTVTPRQRRFFWAMAAKQKKMGDLRASGAWKAMALSETITIRLPKRQFMGYSNLLERRIQQHVERGLENALK